MSENYCRKPNTADAVNAIKIQRKTSVSLPVEIGDSMASPVSRESSTAPELGLSSQMQMKYNMGIKGEQSVLLNVDSPPPSTMLLVDSSYSGIGNGECGVPLSFESLKGSHARYDLESDGVQISTQETARIEDVPPSLLENASSGST